MNWSTEYPNYGVVKIENTKVHIYKSQYSYITINVNEKVVNAPWAGGELNISLANGKVRRYSSQYNYKTV